MAAFIIIRNLSHAVPKPARIKWCESFLCRLRGLMFRSSLGVDEGLLLGIARDSRLDSSIHMFFVPFDLAVIWINSELQVVDKILAKSWAPAYFPKAAARYTLEIHPDRLGEFNIGDQVEFQNA
jgi:uncharacterized membrane protein (UPF0127 family)